MSSFVLKILACFFMLVDHIGYCLFPNVSLLRTVGRLAFPIFAFQIALGYKKTKSKKNYFLRMLVFAMISEIPFLIFRYVSGYSTLAFNIGFTFVLALGALYFIELSKSKNILFSILIIPLLLIAYYLNVDYKWYGIIIVMIFYLFDLKKPFGFTAALITFILSTAVYIYGFNASSIQMYAVISIFILGFFNNKKGRDFKYFFYIFYPAHMLLLSFIKCIM